MFNFRQKFRSGFYAFCEFFWENQTSEKIFQTAQEKKFARSGCLHEKQPDREKN